MLTDPDGIRRLALDANARDEVVGLIAWMHTFSPAKMWIAGLEALQKPLLHLHTQANLELPWDEIDFDFMNLNQAAHGDREFGYIQTRLGVARKTVAGHVSDPRVCQEVEDWQRASAGWAAARSLRIARFGDNMRYVAVTEGDKTEAEVRFGVQVNTWGVNELAEAVADVADAEIDALVDEYVASYDVAPELVPGGDRHQSLRDGAAIERGLRHFLEAGRFGAFTTSFEDLGALRQLPGLAVQRLMAEGYGFGAEGDWKTALLVRVANVMGSGLPGGASLMEDYTYDLVPGEERILGAHMLEVSPSLTVATPRLEVHPLGIGGKDDPVRLVFTADPGPAVVVALSDMRDRFRLVANVVENVDRTGPADAPGRPSGVAAGSRLRHLRLLLARRRGGAPHGDDDGGRRRRLPGLRRDGSDRAAGDRRRHDGARLPAGAAVEPGVLPAGAGPLNAHYARRVDDDPLVTRPRLISGGRAEEPTDPRVAAVLEVLAGSSTTEVAVRWSVDPALVHRWVRAFVDAGTAQVTNRPDPEAASQRDRFLAAFAHELRTPLTVAQGWVAMLAEDDVPPAALTRTVERLEEALGRLADRIVDVELLASASLGLIRLTPEPVMVGALVAGLPGLGEVGGEGPEVEVVVDPDLFRLVLRDTWLAWSARPEPRSLSIEVALVPPWVELRIVRDADPIDPEVLQALFEPFDLNDDGTGVTIGLYLARALVIAHGGTLGVDQDQDGAVLWVRIPRRPTSTTA